MKKILFIGLLFLAGCSTLKKDQKNLAIIQVRHPEILHEYCALTFPVKPTGTVFIPANNVDYSDSLERLNKETFDLQQSNQELILELQKALIAATGDTSCQSIIRALQLKFQTTTDQLEAYKKKLADLRNSYVPCIPDTLRDTIPDLAAVQVQKDRADKAQAGYNDQLKKNAELEQASAHKMYIIFSLGIALLVMTYLFIKKK